MMVEVEKRIRFNYYKEYLIEIAWLILDCILFYYLSARFISGICLIFIISDIIAMITNRKKYKKVIEKLKDEKNIIYQYDNKLICTDNYLISYSDDFFAIKYEDIYYVYKRSNMGYNYFYKCLHIATKDQRKYHIYYFSSQIIKEVINIIKEHNENTVVINEEKRRNIKKKINKLNDFLKDN